MVSELFFSNMVSELCFSNMESELCFSNMVSEKVTSFYLLHFLGNNIFYLLGTHYLVVLQVDLLDLAILLQDWGLFSLISDPHYSDFSEIFQIFLVFS